MSCTHDCNQGDSCTCASCDTAGGLWIRIPDLVLLTIIAATIGVILGVQLVRVGMAA